jgi:hypothetical protein
MFCENGYLIVELPELHTPYRRIDIECSLDNDGDLLNLHAI